MKISVAKPFSYYINGKVYTPTELPLQIIKEYDSVEVVISFTQGLCHYSGESTTPESNWVELQFQYRRGSEEWKDLTADGTLKIEAAKTSPFAHKYWCQVNFNAGTSGEKLNIRGRVFAKENEPSVQSLDTVQWTVFCGLLLRGT